MRVHLQREIDKLKIQILALGAEVEDNVRAAVRSTEERDAALAHAVIKRDSDTDMQEVNVEEECLKILALHQPVASDLRYIIAVFKINNDLERIGDLAVHIAERGLFLCSQPSLEKSFPLGVMAEKSQQMLKKVLNAFVHVDAYAAREVWLADNEIDDMNHEIFNIVKEAIVRNPGSLEALLQIMHIARHLERIADHATNIAEDLIYLIEGKIVRHQPAAEIGERAESNPGLDVNKSK
jgi:phosphate transport system protein